MNKIPFGIRFYINDYAFFALTEFMANADDFYNDGRDDLVERYRSFLRKLITGHIKPATLIDQDIIQEFAFDLYMKASVDYLKPTASEKHDTMDGGKLLLGRYSALQDFHTLERHPADKEQSA